MNQESYQDGSKLFQLLTRFDALEEGTGSAAFSQDEWLLIIRHFEEDLLFDRALEAVELALEMYPFTIDLLLNKAQIQISAQMEELAMGTLDKAEALAPDEFDIHILRVEALISLELYEDAHSLLNHLKHTPNTADLSKVFFSEGLLYESLEQYDQMFYSLRAAVQEDPNNVEALERMWICVELSKMYRESIILHEEILDQDPYSYQAWYNLGHAYAYFGRYEAAIEAYEFAFVINEKFEFAYRDCAEICYELRKYRQALKCYSEVLNHFEADQDLFLRIGQCYQHLGNLAFAKSFFEKAARLDSMNDEVFFHLGECYALEYDFKIAIQFYQKAIRIEDRREEYYAAMADAHWQLNQPELAEPLFQKATEVAPETTEYWIQHASFLMRTEQYDAAIDVLLEAEDYAVGTELLYCRIACLFAKGYRQEALYLLGDALDENYGLHRQLFDLMPRLEEDTQVLAMIAAFQPI